MERGRNDHSRPEAECPSINGSKSGVRGTESSFSWAPSVLFLQKYVKESGKESGKESVKESGKDRRWMLPSGLYIGEAKSQRRTNPPHVD